MKNKLLQLTTVFLLGVGIAGLQAQEAKAASGGNASGSGGSVSYSVGQVFFTICTGTNGSVAHGVQQPFEISVVSGIEEDNPITLSVSVYPNPTTDAVQLKVENYQGENISYQLFDMNGRLSGKKKLTESQSGIKMRTLSRGTYFLKVYDGSKEIKTFKIIKN
jgi:hypothetical protein